MLQESSLLCPCVILWLGHLNKEEGQAVWTVNPLTSHSESRASSSCQTGVCSTGSRKKVLIIPKQNFQIIGKETTIKNREVYPLVNSCLLLGRIINQPIIDGYEIALTVQCEGKMKQLGSGGAHLQS